MNNINLDGLTIKQVSDILNIPKSKIRYWQSQFSAELPVDRTGGNQRRFDASDVSTLKKIRSLLEEDGYTIDGAKRRLSLMKHAEDGCLERILKMAVNEIQSGSSIEEVAIRYKDMFLTLAH